MEILTKIKNLLFPPKKEEEPIEENIPNFSSDLVQIIDVSPNVYLAHRAARICIGKEVNPNIEERIKSLENIINVKKHESITEHTNVIALYRIYPSFIEKYPNEYAEFLLNLRYCHCVKDDFQYILVGGSARAFMHVLRECKSNNFFLNYIKETIYCSFEKCFFKNFIDNGILDEERCTYLQDAKIKLVSSKPTQLLNSRENIDEENYDAEIEHEEYIEVPSDHVDLIYQASVNDIYKKIQPLGFTMKDVYKVSTVSFLFHDISRSCSHQLVRHRNAISQESQRYVSAKYTNEDFINPLELMKEERYGDPKYRDVFTKIKSTDLFKMYKYLIDQKVSKEDARAFLPTNVKTKLMMTMTYENFAYFLKLRLDTAAQKEIRNAAEECANLVVSDIENFINYVIDPFFLVKNDGKDLFLEEYLINQVDEEEVVPYEDPTPMDISSQEKAQELLDQQEKYKKFN